MNDTGPKIVSYTLETPLMRGETALTKLNFRSPKGGDFRGLSVARLGQLDYDEMRKLLPRISMDGLVDMEVDQIEADDVIEIALLLSDFFQTDRRKADTRIG